MVYQGPTPIENTEQNEWGMSQPWTKMAELKLSFFKGVLTWMQKILSSGLLVVCRKQLELDAEAGIKSPVPVEGMHNITFRVLLRLAAEQNV